MSQREKILQLLKTGPATNQQLNKVCYRYGARIHELRNAGHNIVSEQIDRGLWQFRLEEQSRG
ncbi:helix-turn-helix domain-containing protein [Arthrobacter sp. 31Y]|uniref:helix-turn-helix domain-containing protein n=1 Tax=Arthrobacter sp. 31Y TaxID=1115632 RepID=UPI0004632A01|nr:helix-turn-helix domain-containing protein [Arthrobacter sp. 31Y]